MTQTEEHPESNVVRLESRLSTAERCGVPPVFVDLLAAVLKSYAPLHKYGEWGKMLLAVGMTMRRLRDARPLHEWFPIGDALACRASALLNFMTDRDWPEAATINVLHGDDPAPIRAAARAPLKKGEGLLDCRFEPATFLPILEEERGESAPAQPAA